MGLGRSKPAPKTAPVAGGEPIKKKARFGVKLGDNVTKDTLEAGSRSDQKIKGGKPNQMNKYLLKFPKISEAYTLLYRSFASLGSDSEKQLPHGQMFKSKIDGTAVVKCLNLCGAEFKDESALDALSSAKTVTFKDLILGISKLFRDANGGHSPLTKSSDSNKAKTCEKIIKGFSIVNDMFRSIDEDGSGEITFDEFKEAFAGLSLGSDSKIYQNRMNELDFNKDQEITYPEFCVGISVWVGIVDEI